MQSNNVKIPAISVQILEIPPEKLYTGSAS